MRKNLSRRGLLKGLTALTLLLTIPLKLMARATEAFESTRVDKIYATLFGNMEIEPSKDVTLKAPEIAENGAVVPISISTRITGVESISVVVDKNPTPLSATFQFGPTSPADISMRVKMGESSIIRALVKTKDKVYMASREVKVTIGGCGG
ncbi:MAG: sulfur-oxidizing protein SoxY [Candidatus Azotimanducaceae bacterium]|jgi:sulfur-oxidizing protein SoxY